MINIISKNDDRLLPKKEKALLDLPCRYLSSMGIVEACELVKNGALKTRNNSDLFVP